MFRLTIVTGYPEQSSLPWPGELVIRSTITYGGGDEISESMVIRWACVKELATVNMGRDENKGFIRLFIGGL